MGCTSIYVHIRAGDEPTLHKHPDGPRLSVLLGPGMPPLIFSDIATYDAWIESQDRQRAAIGANACNGDPLPGLTETVG